MNVILRLDLHIHGPIHVHVENPELAASIAQLKQIVLDQTQEIKMALSTAEQNIVDRFNAATSALAAKIQSLIDNPPADDTEFNAQLQTIADGLEKLGAPGTPLPPTV